jgi:hypothetical protein
MRPILSRAATPCNAHCALRNAGFRRPDRTGGCALATRARERLPLGAPAPCRTRLAALPVRLPRYELRPLDRAGVAILTTGLLGMPVGRRLAAELYEATG